MALGSFKKYKKTKKKQKQKEEELLYIYNIMKVHMLSYLASWMSKKQSIVVVAYACESIWIKSFEKLMFKKI